MPLDDAVEDKSAEAVPAEGQATEQEVRTSEPSNPEAQTEGFRVGDTSYTSLEEMGTAFKKFQGEYTRTRQEFSKLKEASEERQYLVDLISGDPELLARVKAKVAGGQSPAKAVAQIAQEMSDPRVDGIQEKLDSMEQERAQERFTAAHEDLTEEDGDSIASWLEENSEWLDRSGLSYDQMLDLAWKSHFATHRAGQLVKKGQEMVEKAVRNGEKSRILGSSSPTASAATSVSGKKSHRDMTPSERLDFALQLFNKAKGAKQP